MSGLSVKHRLFVEEYLLCLNATEAYQKVYSTVDYDTASVNAHRLLRNAKISEVINERITEHAMSANEVLARLGLHARTGTSNFVEIPEPTEAEPSPQPYLNLHKAKRLRKLDAIKKLKQTTRTTNDGEVIRTLEVELYDAQVALQLIGKNLGLFADQLKLTKALEEALDLLEQDLPHDVYEHVLAVLAKLGGFSAPTSTAKASSDDAAE